MTAEEAMQWFLAHPEDFDKCCLCGCPPAYIGIFAPTNSVKFGGRPDKQRLFGYAICEECKQEKDSQEHVERIVLAKYHD